ncbi:hypothetical protein NC651_038076 [Populus alba x Populus x berolinensis]|nr:hypothetical protein NC651_038076 [Populus alba x Populus x berolinensis]
MPVLVFVLNEFLITSTLNFFHVLCSQPFLVRRIVWLSIAISKHSQELGFELGKCSRAQKNKLSQGPTLKKRAIISTKKSVSTCY